MCDCHDFVLLGPERLFDLRHIDSPAEIGTQLVDMGAISLKADKSSRGLSRQRAHARRKSYYVPVCKAIAKISRVEYQSIFSGLYEVSRNLQLCILVSVTIGGGGILHACLIPS